MDKTNKYLIDISNVLALKDNRIKSDDKQDKIFKEIKCTLDILNDTDKTAYEYLKLFPKIFTNKKRKIDYISEEDSQ